MDVPTVITEDVRDEHGLVDVVDVLFLEVPERDSADAQVSQVSVPVVSHSMHLPHTHRLGDGESDIPMSYRLSIVMNGCE